jgi:hypothetical protein
MPGHRDEILSWLKSTPHMQVIEIDYPPLVRQPPLAAALDAN